MKSSESIKFFSTENAALDYICVINQARRAAGNMDLMVVTDGPEDNFAAVDLTTAIELGGGYKWEG